MTSEMATEKRLIDAYAFGIFLMGRMGFNPANAETVSQWMDEFIKKNTVDAVEVVRCKDCKHGEVDDPDFPDQYYCHCGHMWNSGCHFCADGERRTNERKSD